MGLGEHGVESAASMSLEPTAPRSTAARVSLGALGPRSSALANGRSHGMDRKSTRQRRSAAATSRCGRQRPKLSCCGAAATSSAPAPRTPQPLLDRNKRRWARRRPASQHEKEDSSARPWSGIFQSRRGHRRSRNRRRRSPRRVKSSRAAHFLRRPDAGSSGATSNCWATSFRLAGSLRRRRRATRRIQGVGRLAFPSRAAPSPTAAALPDHQLAGCATRRPAGHVVARCAAPATTTGMDRAGDGVFAVVR